MWLIPSTVKLTTITKGSGILYIFCGELSYLGCVCSVYYVSFFLGDDMLWFAQDVESSFWLDVFSDGF